MTMGPAACTRCRTRDQSRWCHLRTEHGPALDYSNSPERGLSCWRKRFVPATLDGFGFVAMLSCVSSAEQSIKTTHAFSPRQTTTNHSYLAIYATAEKLFRLTRVFQVPCSIVIIITQLSILAFTAGILSPLHAELVLDSSLAPSSCPLVVSCSPFFFFLSRLFWTSTPLLTASTACFGVSFSFAQRPQSCPHYLRAACLFSPSFLVLSFRCRVRAFQYHFRDALVPFV
jgi:hypothetical protein